MKRALSLCCAIAVAAIAVSGCGTAGKMTPKADTVFLVPDYASRGIGTVALLPMANTTGEADAEKILGNALESQLADRTDYEFMTVERLRRKAQVVGLSDGLESLQRQWVQTREFNAGLSRKLADELEVDAFLVGEITKWDKKDLQPQETGYPSSEVSVRVHLMEARTGEKLWEATADRIVKGQYYDPTDQEVTQFVDDAGIVRGSGGKPVQTIEAPSIREVADEVAADLAMAIPEKTAPAKE